MPVLDGSGPGQVLDQNGTNGLANFGGVGQSGQLNIAGNANLDGTLTLTPVNGYTPTTGDAFTILTYASRNGDFAFLNIPAGGVWDPNAGTVTF